MASHSPRNCRASERYFFFCVVTSNHPPFLVINVDYPPNIFCLIIIYIVYNVKRYSTSLNCSLIWHTLSYLLSLFSVQIEDKGQKKKKKTLSWFYLILGHELFWPALFLIIVYSISLMIFTLLLTRKTIVLCGSCWFFFSFLFSV